MAKLFAASLTVLVLPLFIFNGFLQADTPVEEIEIPGLLSSKEVKAITCGTGEKVVDHMSEMGDIISDLGDYLDALLNPEVDVESQKELKALIIKQSQLLRVHLAAVLVKNPPKLMKIDPENPARAKIIFQEYLLMVVDKTIAIEKTLLEDYEEPSQIKEQNVEVAALLVSIRDIVGGAHSMFR